MEEYVEFWKQKLLLNPARESSALNSDIQVHEEDASSISYNVTHIFQTVTLSIAAEFVLVSSMENISKKP